MSERENMELTPEQEQELRASLRALGEVRAADAFRDRLREQFVSGAIAESGEEPEAPQAEIVALPARRRWPWAMAGVAAIAAALAFVLLAGGDPAWQLRELRGAGAVAIAGVPLTDTDRAGISELFTPGAPVTVAEGAGVDFLLGDVMVVGLNGPGEFTLVAASPGRHEVSVGGGEFLFMSGPGFTGHRMLMHTIEGTVEITGTTVAVNKMDGVTCVCVLEGTASVGRDGVNMHDVPAGMRKVMFADGREPMIIPIEPGHRDHLVEFAEANAATFR